MVKRALLSVYDKTQIVELAHALQDSGWDILSTGKTFSLLKDHQIKATEVSQWTQFPECLDGRVKTLHPKIHGSILFDRKNPKHLQEAKTHGMEGIDMVVVNLYPFHKARDEKQPLEHAIELIDIGGPTMLRAAAKNFASCAAVIDPADYPQLIAELRAHGTVSPSLRIQLAAKVFRETAYYDAMISEYFDSSHSQESSSVHFSDQLVVDRTLRYGENPSQKAAVLRRAHASRFGLSNIKIHQGKELSYNNYLDLGAGTELVLEFGQVPTVAIIKHTNPCGVASADQSSFSRLFPDALAVDSKSAFGGIVATNCTVDSTGAKAMSDLFLECVIAPKFEDQALEILAAKKNLRVVECPDLTAQSQEFVLLRSVWGADLMQTSDSRVDMDDFKVVTEKKAEMDVARDLLLAMRVCKHVKSNAIVIANKGHILGIGAGQMSRIDSARIAIMKALEYGRDLAGASIASDAFFPFRDVVDLFATYRIKGIIQPGGSIRDQDSIAACNEYGMTMVMTGARHFKH